MSVNNFWGADRNKLDQKYGRFFFFFYIEVCKPPTKQDFNRNQENVPVGKFKIGSNSYDLTLSELNQLIETCNVAKTTFFQKYRLGV